MRSIPRDVSADDLIKRLRRIGYSRAKQEGSHISCVKEGEKRHRVIVPRHNPIRVGTLQDIIRRLAVQLEKSEDEVMDLLGL